jgi:hypothetical protein
VKTILFALSKIVSPQILYAEGCRGLISLKRFYWSESNAMVKTALQEINKLVFELTDRPPCYPDLLHLDLSPTLKSKKKIFERNGLFQEEINK